MRPECNVEFQRRGEIHLKRLPLLSHSAVVVVTTRGRVESGASVIHYPLLSQPSIAITIAIVTSPSPTIRLHRKHEYENFPVINGTMS